MRLPSVQYELINFSGGVDLVTPSYVLAPGALRDVVNFAVNPQGGYYRIPGYERFNGMVSPSTAAVTVLEINYVDQLPAIGDPITIGGISAVVCGVGNVGQPYLAVTKYTGGMVVGDAVINSSVTIGTATMQALRSLVIRRERFIQSG
jgi:hypothetical protein